MGALKIIRKASVIDSVKDTDNAQYSVRYQYDEFEGVKTLQAVHVEIAENQDVGEGVTASVNIGSMDYNSDQISMSGFPYSAKTTTYMNEFTEIVEEIKDIINGDKKAPSL